jgi:hypothetical protein
MIPVLVDQAGKNLRNVSSLRNIMHLIDDI